MHLKIILHSELTRELRGLCYEISLSEVKGFSILFYSFKDNRHLLNVAIVQLKVTDKVDRFFIEGHKLINREVREISRKMIKAGLVNIKTRCLKDWLDLDSNDEIIGFLKD